MINKILNYFYRKHKAISNPDCWMVKPRWLEKQDWSICARHCCDEKKIDDYYCTKHEEEARALINEVRWTAKLKKD